MKKLWLGLLVLVLLTGSVACASKEESPPAYYQNGVKDSVSSGSRGISPPVAVTRVPGPAVAVPPAAPVPAPAIAPSKGGTSYSYDSSIPGERMIIRMASMSLVVDDVSAAVAQITSLAAAYGGFVVNSNLYEGNSRLYADISFRVESARFNEALQSLRNLAADVRSESTSGQDVTEEYVDLAARLHNLEVTQAQLEKLMEKTTEKVTDILEVQRELSRVTGEIEQTKGRMQYLEKSSNLALIQATLEQSKLAVEFTADTRTIKEGRKVWFSPEISGGFAPYSYEWDFGDGQTSTEEQPSHVYRNDGTYTVTLKIKDDKANTANFERKDYITVLPGWDAGNVAGGAWNALAAFGRFLVTLIIGIGIFSPVWIVILVILYFAWWRRRKKAK